MTGLTRERCEACRPDALPVTGVALGRLLQGLTGWSIVNQDGVPRLEKRFRFPDLAHALAFTNRVGALAEAEGRHPRPTTESGSVVVTWWTRTVRGLHRNDPIVAAKTDGL